MASDRRNEASTSRGSNSQLETVLVDCGRRRSSCGYCRSPGRTSVSHGFWAKTIMVEDYQDLLDRGWRRSGCYLYKPEMERMCCPSYAIRLRADDFVPSKEQLRVLRRMERFLDGTFNAKKSNVSHEPTISSKFAPCDLPTAPSEHNPPAKTFPNDTSDLISSDLSEVVDRAVQAVAAIGDLPADTKLPKASVKKVAEGRRRLLVKEKEELLLYTCNVAFQIAAALRRTVPPQGNSLCSESIAGKLALYLSKLPEITDLEIRACNGHVNFYSAATVMSSKNPKATCAPKEGCPKRKTPKQQAETRRLEIRLRKSCFDREEFELYRRYQIRVHNERSDQVTEVSYRAFLVDSPLVFSSSSSSFSYYSSQSGDMSVSFCGFGSFHQQYVIDGQLVAVGVIDVLPGCLSSKYLFWDPDFAFLSLGKYSALQEISWVKENQAHCQSLQYYYLGYYIHSCLKMRYKATYRPSELLCPLLHKWVSFDTVRPLLDAKPRLVLSFEDGASLPSRVSQDSLKLQSDGDLDVLSDTDMHENDEIDELEFETSDNESDTDIESLRSNEEENDDDLDDMLIGLEESHVKYKDICHAFIPNKRTCLESKLRRFKELVGKELSKRVVYALW